MGRFPSKEEIKNIAEQCGIAACGIVSAEDDIAEYRRFLECTENLPKELSYMRRPWDKRRRLSLWDSRAKSALVCAFPYWDASRSYSFEMNAIDSSEGGAEAYLIRTGRQNLQYSLLRRPEAKISRYALTADYHKWAKERLRKVRDALKAINPAICGSVFCDTSPVLEKELARLAGLGFRGRNTLIISPKFGSWFFIGGLTLNFSAGPDEPCELPQLPGGNWQGCGSCHICETVCPAGALSGGRIEQGKCFSFLTTQSKKQMFGEIGAKHQFPPYSYGCDICQEHCPYNKKNKALL